MNQHAKCLSLGSLEATPPSEANERVVLGIDPGTQVMGYCVVRGQGRALPALLSVGALRLTSYGDAYERLGYIYSSMRELIARYHPTEMAIEAPFFGKNPQSMLKLGRAQGVAIAAGISAGLPVVEYAPRKIRVGLMGVGNASKEQVASFLKRLYPDAQLDLLRLMDATDAMAVAVSHFMGAASPAEARAKHRSSSESWRDFLSRNAHRVKKP